jgi:hypothetical protein
LIVSLLSLAIGGNGGLYSTSLTPVSVSKSMSKLSSHYRIIGCVFSIRRAATSLPFTLSVPVLGASDAGEIAAHQRAQQSGSGQAP